MSPPATTAETLVIGAGLAGLTAARELRNRGRRVLVLEKSRGLGGRAATRRWNGCPVDHGAQFFTARSPEFRQQVDRWLADSVCFEWSRGFHQWQDGSLRPPGEDAYPRYACHEGMASLGRALAGADAEFVQRETRAVSVKSGGTGWQVTTTNGTLYEAPALLLAVPPTQALTLLPPGMTLVRGFLEGVTLDPSLTVVARYPRLSPAWRGIQLPDHPILSWISHDTSKRSSLHPGATILVLHAGAGFSKAHAEAEETAIVHEMLTAASAVTGLNLQHPDDYFMQKWRYALATPQPPDTPLFRFVDTANPLAVAGDAVAGGKIEGAWLSGRAAGRALAGN